MAKKLMEVDHLRIIEKYIYTDLTTLDGSIQEYKEDILKCTLQASVDTMTVVLDNATLNQSDRFTLLNMRTHAINQLKNLTNKTQF